MTHYLFIFISLATVIVFYGLIFFNLRRRQNQPELELSQSQSKDPFRPKSSLDVRTSVNQGTSAPVTAAKAHNGHHPAFLIYPIIYVACTAPLAIGRIATMVGAQVPLGYFCAAGALITSNGWLDVLVWGLTRRVLLFESDIDAQDGGIETFAFMRTPPGRRYGNMVWVQGASDPGAAAQEQAARADEAKDGFGWWRAAAWRRGMGRRPSAATGRGFNGGLARGDRRIARSVSQESLRGRSDMVGIQMDTVTSVQVEINVDKAAARHREYSVSENGSDKEVQHHRI